MDNKKQGIDLFSVAKIHDEIGALSSYLNFGYETFKTTYKATAKRQAENVKEIRRLENIPDEVSDRDIFLKAIDVQFAYNMIDDDRQEEFTNDPRLSAWVALSIPNYEFDTLNEHEKTFYATIVIMLYSCIERGLKSLCSLQGKMETNLLDDARYFLDYKIDCKIDNALWKELKYIRWIRNTIVHSGLSFLVLDIDEYGDLRVDAKPDLVEYLISKGVYEEPYISINLSYCKYAIGFANNFFSEIRTLYRNKKTDKSEGSHGQLPVWLLEALKKTPKDDENQNDNN